MKFPKKTTIILVLIGGASAVAFGPASEYLKERRRIQYKFQKLGRGDIVAEVNSSGTVKPVRSVSIGAFVSGPIVELRVDFNDEVKAGDLLASIDPLLYNAIVARDRAILATRKAECERVKAQLQLAINDFNRATTVRAENKDFVSDAEMDKFRFSKMALEADLEVAKTQIASALASLENSEANLGYTKILAPVDGIVIDRKIDPGQTLAAQFQTPELFVVAPDMKVRMHVFASVDEADIGLIRDSQARKQPVRFTVDAYPDDLFEGEIFQVRASATTTQNVVTYPVVVAAPNPDLKLLPGMTASLSFQIAEVRDVVRIPNAALRYFPPIEQVRMEDRDLIEGSATVDASEQSTTRRSARDKAAAARNRSRRHVWVLEDDLLRAVEVITGISDNDFTELVSGELEPDQSLVTGVQPKN